MIFKSSYSEYIWAKRIFLVFLLLNFAVWFCFTKNIRPDLTITPTPPGSHLLKAFSMGDDNLVYRHFAYKIQMSGDDYGTTTPLKNYSYEKLQKWFILVTEFDKKSEYIPSLAGLYFSNSQNAMDNVYIVDYLVSFAMSDPNKYWRWLSTSVYLSHVKLHDLERVKRISAILGKLDKDTVPLWARTIGIFMTSKQDICSSLELIASLDQKEIEDIANDKIFGAKKDQEANIFLKLIVDRIEELKKNPDAVRRCIMNKNKR